MDRPLPDDFDQYGERVNYGRIEGSNGNGKLIWWVLGGMMALNVGVAVAGIGFVGSALYNMNARLAVVETRLSECSK